MERSDNEEIKFPIWMIILFYILIIYIGFNL